MLEFETDKIQYLFEAPIKALANAPQIWNVHLENM